MAANGNRHIRFNLSDITQARRDHTGFCIQCGAVRDCCEPDARAYECETCDDFSVFGAEEIALMGLVDIDDEPGNAALADERFGEAAHG